MSSFFAQLVSAIQDRPACSQSYLLNSFLRVAASEGQIREFLHVFFPISSYE